MYKKRGYIFLNSYILEYYSWFYQDSFTFFKPYKSYKFSIKSLIVFRKCYWSFLINEKHSSEHASLIEYKAKMF